MLRWLGIKFQVTATTLFVIFTLLITSYHLYTMDRSSFLSCLPFLSSETFLAWPPSTSYTKIHPFDEKHGDISALQLEGYLLSIEPRCTNAKETTFGPACFSSPSVAKLLSDEVQGDSSICPFQMTVVLPIMNQNKPSSPEGSASTSGTGTTSSQSPKTPLRTANADIAFRRSNLVAAKVFVRIDDKHCFRMDMRQLEKMELQVPDSSDGNNNEKKATAQKPPCLLLIYPTCCFRIFSLSEDQNSTHKELESIYHRLQTCWESLSFPRDGMVGGIFPHDWNNSCGTSSGSSGGHGASSNEAGQRQTTTTATTTTIAGGGMAHASSNGPDNQKQEDGKAALRLVRQRQKCFAKSREGLRSLNAVLDMPAWIWEGSDPKRRRVLQEGADDGLDDDVDVDKKIESNALRDHLSDSLCSTADNLSSSFWVNRSEKQQIAQFYETKVQQQDDEMEQLLAVAFPRSHRGRFPSSATSPEAAAAGNKRNRKVPSPPGLTAPSPAQTETPAVTQDPTQNGAQTRRRLLLQAKEAMNRQRQAIVGRHKLSLLPTRW